MEPTIDLDLARRTLSAEGQAISGLAEGLGDEFSAAARLVYACRGQVVLTGIGKAGIIARKISATLASTGTRSIFLHPVEALHGDLGRLARGDVVIALSHSGASEEIVRLLDHIKARGAALVAFTGFLDSPLGRHADVTVCYGQVQEACPLGLAPTVSTACMLALGDAIALTVMQMRHFRPEEFATFHPGGSLGRRLMKVEDAMTSRQGERLVLACCDSTLRQALAEGERATRRAGAMIVVDADGALAGIVTDGDLRRLLLRHGSDVLDLPLQQVMSRQPKHVHIGELASAALATMNQHRIDELPVLDDHHKPVGLIDVQDLLGLKTVNDARD